MTVTIPSTSKNSLKLNGITPSALGLSLLQSTNRLVVGSGLVTSNNPILDLSQTWNNAAVAFSGIKLNVTDTASASGSLLADFQVGGVSKINFQKDGVAVFNVAASQNITLTTYAGTPSISWSTASGGGRTFFLPYSFGLAGCRFDCYWTAPQPHYRAGNDNGTISYFQLWGESADTLALRNGVNAQTFNIYKTYTNDSNYERLGIISSGVEFVIKTQKLGTGSNINLFLGTDNAGSLYLMTNNISRWYVNSTGHFFGSANNTYDIGAGTNNNPRNIYAGTSLQIISNTGYLGIGASFPDVFLYREAANTFAQRNGVNAQVFNIYNTWSNAGADYERLSIWFATGNAAITTQAGGTGATTRHLYLGTGGAGTLYFQTNNTVRFQVASTTGHLLASADNTYDIGASGANRPRNIYAAGKIKGQIQTDANATAETITPTHTITLYDAAGVAYKVPCVAA